MVTGFLALFEHSVRQKQTIAVLIASPADCCAALADAVNFESGNRTAMRYERKRNLGDISIVGHAKLGNEHDIAANIPKVVSFIFLQADIVKLPSRGVQGYGIKSHESIQIARVCYHTNDNLAVI